MDSHTIKAFDTELQILRSRLGEIGDLVKSQVAAAVSALAKRDKAVAGPVISLQSQVDALHRALEDQAVVTIARRQPMAVDLREVVSILRISTDLQRVGELAQDIGKRVLEMSDRPAPLRQLTRSVRRMGLLSLERLAAVLDSYAKRDLAAALAVWRGDTDIDDLYAALVRELLTYMMEGQRHITSSLHLMFCAKDFERIGDHATNIAESVYYVAEGRAIGDERPKGQSAIPSGAPAGGRTPLRIQDR
jgi:phosphate transport system protein